MTVLGRHTITETRELIASVEFRAKQYIAQLTKVQQSRTNEPKTPAQAQLDKDMAAFVRRWIPLRDSNIRALAVSQAATSIPPSAIPAESNFVSVTDGVTRTDPRLIFIQQRVDNESAALGLAPVDLRAIPPQNAPDIDITVLQAIDKAAAATGLPVPGGPNDPLNGGLFKPPPPPSFWSEHHETVILGGGVFLFLGGLALYHHMNKK